MNTILDYQEIINLTAELVRVALPIGIIFGLTSKMLKFFFSLAFGDKNVKL